MIKCGLFGLVCLENSEESSGNIDFEVLVHTFVGLMVHHVHNSFTSCRIQTPETIKSTLI